MNFEGYLCSFLLFVACISSASCIQCHDCNSGISGQEDCETITKESTKYLKNCEAPLNISCRVQEQWVDFEVLKQRSEKRTVRQCASTVFDPSKACYYRTGFGGKVSVCNCIEDGCNSTPRLASTLLMTLVLLLALKLFS